LSELDPDWLSGVLGDSFGRVLSFEAESIGAGVGLMGELARLHLEIEGAPDGVAQRVVVKLPSNDPVARASAQLLGLYEREARFYTELAPALPVRTPHCFFAAAEPKPNAPADPEAFERRLARLPMWLMQGLVRFGEWVEKRAPRSAILVLEDLGELRAGDQVAGGGPGDWELAIEHLALFHAAAWERPGLIDRPWLARVEPNIRFAQAMFRNRWRRLPAAWDERLSARGRALGHWIERHGEELMRRLCLAPDTLCHGDYRLDNLFFDDARGDVVSIDWQLAIRSPAVFDLAYLLSGVLGPDVDGAGEQELVRMYHARLRSAGGAAEYSVEACLADYQRARLATWSRCLTAVTAIDPADERGVSLLYSWWDRMSARLDDLEPDAVMAGEGRTSG
jgi:hypothetical protein